MVRAFTSHQCGPGSYRGVDAVCGLSFLFVVVSAQGFFGGFQGAAAGTHH